MSKEYAMKTGDAMRKRRAMVWKGVCKGTHSSSGQRVTHQRNKKLANKS